MIPITVSEKILKKSDNYLKMERSTGIFQRSIQLPGPVKSDAMETFYKNGVLTIILPKQR